MGNYISCTLATPLIKNKRAARVIFPGGEVRQCREPVKAAELMFECPNFFLVNSQSLHIGRRFSALSADEELELGNVYVTFPMRRVNSIITAADMAIVFMAANSAAKRISGGKVRILPESGTSGKQEEASSYEAAAAAVEESEVRGSRLSLEDGIEGLSGLEMKYRLSVCRSRKPVLETIKEEQIISR
ncbi:hypothetical protein I3843_06G013400 [Carya illinoinensis]|uniref:DUF4228 domain-containing protein n=1 Tax=Carya illinoinensis TaxID=32201 RepID=A0A922JH28_CARIL|nr:hypothetical protein I3760_06G014100 [Carya illinoinensis]KAG6707093.1 hypothetical protein I3842_06G014300 [Carya illinoinensis]KAG7973766.1 hypothetical protein I3843_06G013400 [Carya illinoinensis]